MFEVDASIYQFMRGYRAKEGGTALVRGGRKTAFDKLFFEIDKVASGLLRAGIGKGDVVMIAAPNIEQSIAAVYAASKLGAVASLVHPKLSENEFAKEFAKQNPKAVFLSDINFFKFAKYAEGALKIFCPYFLPYTYVGLPIGRVRDVKDVGSGGDVAFYMHSGGTSGEPKTVELTAKAVNTFAVNLLSSLGDGFGQSDAMLASLPIFHGYGMCVGIHASLSTSMRAVLVPKFSAKNAVSAFEKNDITTMIAIPRIAEKLLAREDFSGDKLKNLRNIYIGGDELSKSTEGAFNSRLKEAGSTGRVSAGYGLTEACSCVSVNREPFTDGAGRALRGVKTALLSDDGNIFKTGSGELLISSEQIMKGYLNDEKATKEAFLESDGERWLKTGDYFSVSEDGAMTYLGRKKRLIKISGMNVFPIEIERTAKELPFVKECAATDTLVGGKTYISLFLEGRFSEQEKALVKTHISKRLSHWHTPEYIVCVEELPRTNIGKIDFVRLKNEHQSN